MVLTIDHFDEGGAWWRLPITEDRTNAGRHFNVKWETPIQRKMKYERDKLRRGANPAKPQPRGRSLMDPTKP